MLILDPKKRITAKEAIKHPWVLGKANNYIHMDLTVGTMKTFNARRKLKVWLLLLNLMYLMYLMKLKV